MGKLARSTRAWSMGVFCAAVACDGRGSAPSFDFEVPPAADYRGEPVAPLPLTIPHDPAKAALGAKLYVAPEVSSDGTLNCLSCHQFDHGGAEPRALPIYGFRPAKFNSTSIFNLAFMFRFNWTGKWETMHAQLDGPLGPGAMYMSWDQLIQRLSSDAKWVAAFKAVFSDGVTEANIREAFVHYQLTLITPNAPFDQYLRGELGSKYDKRALEGYELFKSLGCASCHQGRNIGGNMYQRIGVMEDYFDERRYRKCEIEGITREKCPTPVAITEADLGRYTATKREEDMYVFRVPSLRNIEESEPYFHDGHEEDLIEAVQLMALVQLGQRLEKSDAAKIKAFLETLSGEVPPAPGEPLLPPPPTRPPGGTP